MYRDPYCYLAEFTGANVVPAGGNITLPVDVDAQHDFEFYRAAALYTSPAVRVSMTDQENRLLHDDGLPAVTVFGHGFWPRSLDATRIIKRSGQMRIRLQDRSAAPNTVRVLLVGARLLPAAPTPIPPFRYAEPWSMAARFGADDSDDIGAVAASGTSQFTRRSPGDSWFEVHSMAVTRSAAATLQITTSGAREWFARPVHVDLLGATTDLGAYQGVGAPLFAPAAWRHEFLPPKMLPPNTSLTFIVTDLSGGGATVRIVMHGVRRYL
jgi:hypothetical protein